MSGNMTEGLSWAFAIALFRQWNFHQTLLTVKQMLLSRIIVSFGIELTANPFGIVLKTPEEHTRLSCSLV